MTDFIMCGTGHRPEDCEPESVVRAKVRKALEDNEVDIFITGMAAGFDLWAGDEARLMGLKIWCARPWTKHPPRKGDEELYLGLMDHASLRIDTIVSDKFPGNFCYHVRNHWMVDNSDSTLAYWNSEKKSGGTFACREYALKKEKPVVDIW